MKERERDEREIGLEGCFAQGHVYVLVSRVTDPGNFALVGLPPYDLLDDLAKALAREGTGYRSGLRKGSFVQF